MTPVTRTRTIAPAMALTVLFLAGSARPAHADITAFLGLSPTPERHFLRGFSGGLSLLIVGFEFEYSNWRRRHRPAAGTQDLFRQRARANANRNHGHQFYATAGAGGYRETLGDAEETHVGDQPRRRREDPAGGAAARQARLSRVPAARHRRSSRRISASTSGAILHSEG